MTVDKFTSDGVTYLSDEQRLEIKEKIKERYGSAIAAKGDRLVVRPYIREEKTKGGIIIADITRDEDQYHSQICQVLSVGPTAYTDKQYCGGVSWADVGDWVVVPRTAGCRVVFRGEESLRIIAEDEIVAVVSDPLDWQIRISATKY